MQSRFSTSAVTAKLHERFAAPNSQIRGVNQQTRSQRVTVAASHWQGRNTRENGSAAMVGVLYMTTRVLVIQNLLSAAACSARRLVTRKPDVAHVAENTATARRATLRPMTRMGLVSLVKYITRALPQGHKYTRVVPAYYAPW